jgi:hypothetical protein
MHRARVSVTVTACAGLRRDSSAVAGAQRDRHDGHERRVDDKPRANDSREVPADTPHQLSTLPRPARETVNER